MSDMIYVYSLTDLKTGRTAQRMKGVNPIDMLYNAFDINKQKYQFKACNENEAQYKTELLLKVVNGVTEKCNKSIGYYKVINLLETSSQNSTSNLRYAVYVYVPKTNRLKEMDFISMEQVQEWLQQYSNCLHSNIIPCVYGQYSLAKINLNTGNIQVILFDDIYAAREELKHQICLANKTQNLPKDWEDILNKTGYLDSVKCTAINGCNNWSLSYKQGTATYNTISEGQVYLSIDITGDNK